MRWLPAVFIAFLAAVAFLGAHLRAYEVSRDARCNYVIAERNHPAARALIVGDSRIGTGFDQNYISELLSDIGAKVPVEQMVMSRPLFSQNYPLLRRYLATRGAPDVTYLLLSYNLYPERQDTWNIPVNNIRNLAFGSYGDLARVQWQAPLNDTGQTLSKTLHAEWQSLPAAWLTKTEMAVFSAVRYLPKRLRNALPDCLADPDTATGNRRWASHLSEARAQDIAYAPPKAAALEKWRGIAADFLPLAPDAPWRQGDTAHLKQLVDLLDAAGSVVVFVHMTHVGQSAIDPADRAAIAALFPEIDILSPITEFDGALRAQLERSFSDPVHATDFAKVHFSRVLAQDLRERLFAEVPQ